MDRKKKVNKYIRNERCEHHSNLALITTVMAMAGFVMLMFVYIGEHNPANVELAMAASRYFGVALWIGAAAFAYNAVKKKKKHLIEYVIYTLILGFGLFFMYNRPNIFVNIVEGTFFEGNWASGVFRVLSVSLVLYALVSIIWHACLGNPTGKKKK